MCVYICLYVRISTDIPNKVFKADFQILKP